MKSHKIFAPLAAITIAAVAAATGAVAAHSSPPTSPYSLADATKELVLPGKNEQAPRVQEKLSELLTTADGQPHPCAGRYLLYRAHVDPIYATTIGPNDELYLGAVAGNVPVWTEKTCVRLAPDAPTIDVTAAKAGQEVSRLAVPASPRYGFLGTPGTILWHASSTSYQDNRPIWAGVGGFEPGHEGPTAEQEAANLARIDQKFAGDVVYVDLVGFTGPENGEVELFADPAGSEIERLLSTRDDISTITIKRGQHGHFDWTFTKPGIYQLQFQVRAKLLAGGEEKSSVHTVTWLVGSDEEVGLPEGVTQTSPITYDVEAQRRDLGLPEIGPDEPWRSGVQLEEALPPAEFGPQRAPTGIGVLAGTGTLTLKAQLADTDLKILPHYQPVDGQVQDLSAVDGKIIIEVPDHQLAQFDQIPDWIRQTPGFGSNWYFFVPGGQDSRIGVQLVADGSQLPFAQIPGEAVHLCVTSFEGPPQRDDASEQYAFLRGPGANIATWQPAPFDCSAVAADKLDAQQPQQLPGLLFSHPGFYESYIDLYSHARGDLYPGDASLYFAVGNEAINQARAVFAEEHPELADQVTLLPERSKGEDTQIPGFQPANPVPAPEPGEEPDSAPEPSVDPDPAPEPGEDPVPAPEPSAEPVSPPPAPNPEPMQPAPAATNLPASIKMLATSGHFDLSAGLEQGVPVGFIKDDHHGVLVDPASVAFVVSDQLRFPMSALLGSDPQVLDFKAAATEFYSLPQVQSEAGPWPGFNTLALDYSQVLPASKPGGGVALQLTKCSGPGKVLATVSVFQQHSAVFSCGDLALQDLSYREPTHKHLAFLFSKPGVYQLEYTYSWRANTAAGELKQAVVPVTFVVGEQAFTAAKQQLGLGAVDAMLPDLNLNLDRAETVTSAEPLVPTGGSTQVVGQPPRANQPAPATPAPAGIRSERQTPTVKPQNPVAAPTITLRTTRPQAVRQQSTTKALTSTTRPSTPARAAVQPQRQQGSANTAGFSRAVPAVANAQSHSRPGTVLTTSRAGTPPLLAAQSSKPGAQTAAGADYGDPQVKAAAAGKDSTSMWLYWLGGLFGAAGLVLLAVKVGGWVLARRELMQ